MHSLLATAAGVAFIVIAAALAMTTRSRRRPGTWLLPATLSAAFTVFSLIAVVREGPTGFWVEHTTRHFWGNQIWFDLLLAGGVAWTMLLPRVRSVGMRPLPWLVVVACTGSIGLCVMFARVLYLEEAGKPS